MAQTRTRAPPTGTARVEPPDGTTPPSRAGARPCSPSSAITPADRSACCSWCCWWWPRSSPVCSPRAAELRPTSTRCGSPPSAAHLFGTDQLGRDILSRVVYGTRITLVVGLLSTVLAAVVGGLIGLVAGSAGGWLDSVLMRFSEILLAFPGILLAMAIVAAAGPNEQDLILAVGVAAVCRRTPS